MRSLAIILLCLAGITISAQNTFEKIITCYGAQYLSSVIQMSDGGFAAIGQIRNTSSDKWLIRTNSIGDTLWTRVFPETGYNTFADRCLSETEDGGLTFLSGFKSPQMTASLTHIDSVGSTDWKKEIYSGKGEAMIRTTGGNVIVGHESDTTIFADITVCKVSDSGGTIWKRGYKLLTVTSSNYQHPEPNAIRETNDGGYIIAGAIVDYAWFPELIYPFLFRIGPAGDSLWYKTFSYDGDFSIYSIDTTTNGRFVTCGQIGSDAFVMKIDVDGDSLWTNKPSLMAGPQYFNSVLSTSDGGAIACGKTIGIFPGPDTSKVYLVKFSASGTIEWERKIANLGNSEGNCIERTLDHGYIICGEVHPYDTTQPGGGLLIKVDANGNFAGVEENTKVSDYKVFPNPASDHVTFSIPELTGVQKTITFFDLYGKEVSRSQIPEGQSEITFPTTDWHPGLYLYLISDGSKTIRGKLFISVNGN